MLKKYSSSFFRYSVSCDLSAAPAPGQSAVPGTMTRQGRRDGHAMVKRWSRDGHAMVTRWSRDGHGHASEP